jgi:hypothetical protein
VITPGGKFVLWTPDEAIKIAGLAKEELAALVEDATERHGGQSVRDEIISCNL